ncbi:DUF6343 family protein [Actinomadura sp. 9N407]|uniref:DUF6343 family protein n=1 Tax=Actinomadura sp. 9N407 TaxID=3375154 RepID=UPI0037AB5AF1
MSDEPRAPEDHRQPPGTEPLTARSPLRLRALLSGFALVVSVAAAVVFTVVAGRGGPGSWAAAGICAVVALIALADLIVIARRARG